MAGFQVDFVGLENLKNSVRKNLTNQVSATLDRITFEGSVEKKNLVLTVYLDLGEIYHRDRIYLFHDNLYVQSHHIKRFEQLKKLGITDTVNFKNTQIDVILEWSEKFLSIKEYVCTSGAKTT